MNQTMRSASRSAREAWGQGEASKGPLRISWRSSSHFAVDPGGVAAEHAIAAGFYEAVGGFDFGAYVLAVHAQGHRLGPGQRVEAAIGTHGEQQQLLDQLLVPGACLPEHLQGLIEGPPLAAGAVAGRLLRRRSLLEEKQ
jgi:hypothetical protein